MQCAVCSPIKWRRSGKRGQPTPTRFRVVYAEARSQWPGEAVVIVTPRQNQNSGERVYVCGVALVPTSGSGERV